MDDRKFFFDAHAMNWDRELNQDDNEKKFAQVVEWLGVQYGDSVLDVGTGTGVLLPFIRRAVGQQGSVVAMDLSRNMLTQAARRASENKVTLLNAGVAAIPLKAGRFDRVTCFSAFPHFPDKKKALSEMARILKQGGALSIAHLHSMEELTALHGTVGGAVQKDRLPDKEAMESLMQDAGLTKVNIVSEPGKYLAQGLKI